MYEALEKVQRIVNGGEVIFEPSKEDMNGYFLCLLYTSDAADE